MSGSRPASGATRNEGEMFASGASQAAELRVSPDDLHKPLHRVEWTVEHGYITGRAVCDGGPQDWCHLACGEGCEAFDFLDHDHPWVSQDECNVVLWINDEGAEHTYIGPDHPATNSLIKPIWVGDSYEWRYADA